MGRALDRLSYRTVLMRTTKNCVCVCVGGVTRDRGMTESVCLLWVLSGRKCAEVHGAMIELSGSKHTTSEQLVPHEKVEISLISPL